jgi:predicted RNA-binding Zn ribbon-like protein
MSPPFQLNAGHPALDFVNTLDDRFSDTGPVELLARYADLLRFARQCDLIGPAGIEVLETRRHARPAAKALRSAHELREALAAIFYAGAAGTRGPVPGTKTLQRHLSSADSHRHLSLDPETGSSGKAPRAVWSWGRFATHAELPVWILAQSAVALLTSSTMDRVATCKSETCRWLFLDTSKNHSRRWCDMKICGNRHKARRFQARHAR